MKKIILGSVIYASALMANPENPQTIHGNVSFEGLETSSLMIHAGDRAIINWGSFSISPNEVTKFIQSSKDAAVLNRVTGQEMSKILGSLKANGKVFLVNQNGILMGKDAIIDVGSFIASSLDLSNKDFVQNKNLLFDGESFAPVTNEGSIQAKNGDILFVAHKVENSGQMTAKGNVFLGAGHRILVGVKGKDILFVDPQLQGEGIDNAGTIEAMNVIIASNASPYSLGIQNRGAVQSYSLKNEGGDVIISSINGKVKNEGAITAENDLLIDGKNSDFENYGSFTSKERLSLRASSSSLVLSKQRPVSNYGKMEAKELSISAPKLENLGLLSGDRSVSLFVPGPFIETESASIKTLGGKINILAGTYCSSGTIDAFGLNGGTIEIAAEEILSLAAHFKAKGVHRGGKILITGTSVQASINLNPATEMDVSGKEKMGLIEIHSPLPVISGAHMVGEVSIPSGQVLASKVSLYDPNPKEETALWASLKGTNDAFYDDTMWQIWDQFSKFELPGEGSIELAACPPVGIEFVDPNPSGVNSSFGNDLLVLSTGNVAVGKDADNFGGLEAGAAYLYNAATGALISILRGSNDDDQVSNGGFFALTNGNYVISSNDWDGNLGAATFGNGLTGVSGTVSVTNSLIGGTAGDAISGSGIVPLANGNYVVLSEQWIDGGMTDVGAATFGNGTTGTVGVVTAANSLVGTQMDDLVGIEATALTNGNYVVQSSSWANGAILGAGAVTFVNGSTGLPVGPVSVANSLVGSTAFDAIGSVVTALVNGNYVVGSPSWDGPASNTGAATFGSGATGISGAVSVANSLHGTTMNDFIAQSIIALTNGNYAVVSSGWNDGGTSDVGAVTIVNGSTGIPLSGAAVGEAVSATNSLIGSTASDFVGNAGVFALTNGNCVVASRLWDGVAVDVGAATFVNGSTGLPVGAVSAANSLVGSTAGDNVGEDGVTALSNGNYAVISPGWSGMGAVTFGNGTSGTVGAVGPTNSIVGSTAGDSVGGNGVTALTNGNYVIASRLWDNGGVANAGAATFVNGTTGLPVGTISAANSLVGTQMNDNVGTEIFPFNNGNYVVRSNSWSNGAVPDVGAITYGDGTTGIQGTITPANSLIGTTANDSIGTSGLFFQLTEQFVFISRLWDDGAVMDVGAITLASLSDGSFCDGTFGAVSSANSFIGANASADLRETTADNANGNFFVAQFRNYSGETRLFAFTGEITPVPVIPPASGIFEFASSITEPFRETMWYRLALKGPLEASSKFPPFQVHKQLRLDLPSLVETQNGAPQILDNR